MFGSAGRGSCIRQNATVTTPAIKVDLAVVRPWWQRLAGEVPPAVVGLWFGMTDVLKPGGHQRTMYVAGCRTFDLDDEDAEWATDHVWLPNGRYIAPPSLASIRACRCDFTGVLEHAATLIRRLEPHVDVNVDGVAVGFDDGDFVVTWPDQQARQG